MSDASDTTEDAIIEEYSGQLAELSDALDRELRKVGKRLQSISVTWPGSLNVIIETENLTKVQNV